MRDKCAGCIHMVLLPILLLFQVVTHHPAAHAAQPATPNQAKTGVAQRPSSGKAALPAASLPLKIPVDRSTQSDVSGGVLVQSSVSSIEARQLASGRSLWTVSIPELLPRRFADTAKATVRWVYSPVVVSNSVFAGVNVGTAGYLMRIDLQTGSLRWLCRMADLQSKSSDQRHSDILSKPTVWRDRIVLRAGSDLVALKIADGNLLWSRLFAAPDGASYTPFADPAVSDNAVYFNADFGIAYAIDPRDGHELWRKVTDAYELSGSLNVYNLHITQANCSPILASGRLFVTDGLRNVYALDPRSGQQLWKSKVAFTYRFQNGNGKLYAATFTGFFELDPATGAVLRQCFPTKPVLEAVVDHNKAFLLDVSGRLTQFDLKNWTTVAQVTGIDAHMRPMLIKGGVLAARSGANQLDRETLEAISFPEKLPAH